MDLENKRRSYFNPRSYKRSDYYRPVPGDPVDEFQSTLLQEERRNHIRKDFPEVFISIHAPTRGATAGFFSSDRTIAHFNPRSYKRSDPVPPAVSALPCYFNPRSYKRSDPQCKEEIMNHNDFNPRSYKRSDSKNAQYSLCISAIIIA